MLLGSTNTLRISSHGKEWEGKTVTGMPLGKVNQRVKVPASQDSEGAITSKIKEMLSKVGLSVSSYDTAWVAMVPTLDSSKQPLFPKSLNWIMENQQSDGSWGLDLQHPLLIKDSLSSTLACVLALQKWNVGQQLIHKGLDFIQSNIWAAKDEHQHSPIGFDIIFPSMIEYGRDMGLNLSLNQSLVETMLLKRELETKSLKDKPSNLAYVAEGLNRLNDWKEVMKFQRSNGSLFNSPSSTAAALIHLHDGKCFEYLNSLAKQFGNAVPTIYPFDIYARLSIIDTLEKLGIDSYVSEDKERVLDDICRCWMQGSEEIFLDPTCCAMAFRLLRMNGYANSSDALANFDEKEKLLHTKDIKAMLELFKASQLEICEDESALCRIYAWTSNYLKEELVNGEIPDKSLQAEVDHALGHPHASMERTEIKNFIENYNADNVSLLKTSYRFCNANENYLLAFSFRDFNMYQSMHREELDDLERWVKQYGLDKLKYARQTIRSAYFSITSSLFQPNHSDARISWAQNTVLTTVVDDFFDFSGSMEELLNLIELIERWDEHTTIGFKSKEVEILFNALYGSVNDLADKAYIVQGRCVKRDLIDIWIILLKTMLKEAEWARDKNVPGMDEYIENGYISFALGPVILISLYLMEPLSEEVVTSKEYDNLFIHASIIGRLLNDRVTAKREFAQGKLNSVSLQVVGSNGAITEEEAKEEVTRIITSHRRELLRMVVQTEGSIVPKSCKNLFWTMSKLLHLFYMSEDGYSSPTKMLSAINAIVNEPIVLP
ncbi:ent-kaurene synthase TSP4, chloroplastic isoform X1 [Ricinus communis]|uniref:ent-kaurene synthase TSP4, chloroplastic isoform X1 n=1 Tax=Ricinus communis TaxID=3988 RepID=UPI00201ABB21|nr:ent-kaurene synthase TSP4, chloroplastic isoform X1 [Ricinus communis]